MDDRRFILPRERAIPVELWPGVMRRTLVWADNAMVCEVEMARGYVVPPHHHVHEQVGYVVKGRMEFTLDGKTGILGPGAGYAIPSNAVHSFVVLEDSIAVDVFSPVREEYKTGVLDEGRRDATP